MLKAVCGVYRESGLVQVRICGAQHIRTVGARPPKMRTALGFKSVAGAEATIA